MTKFLDTRGLRHALAMVLVLFVAISGSSCERFMDGEGYCPTVYKIKFRFTMNMLNADAFPTNVKSVSLFAFNKEGECVRVFTESSEILADENYAMEVDLPAGTYDFVAWCGLDGNEDFSLAESDNPKIKDDLVCTLAHGTRADSDKECRKNLHPLWHARLDDVELPADQEGEAIVGTMYLTKNTNTVRVILHHIKGKELLPHDYDFTITDDNSIMNWDNSLMEADTTTYREFSKRSTVVKMPDQDDGEYEAYSSLVAELDVARLVKEGHGKPYLTVTHPEVKAPVLRIPLIDLLLIAKGEARLDMDDQEYLDRQDEYNLIFFMDDAGWYMNGGIWINSWHIRDFSFNM